MTKVTLDREHIDGVRYLLKAQFESACDAEDEDELRVLLPAMGRIRGWPTGTTIELPEKMVEQLVADAWEAGNDIWGDLYKHRAREGRPDNRYPWDSLSDDERIARSLIAWAEHMRAEPVAT